MMRRVPRKPDALRLWNDVVKLSKTGKRRKTTIQWTSMAILMIAQATTVPTHPSALTAVTLRLHLTPKHTQKPF
jgi:hypothetical protein